MINHCISSLFASFEMSVIICFKFPFVDRLGPTATLILVDTCSCYDITRHIGEFCCLSGHIVSSGGMRSGALRLD